VKDAAISKKSSSPSGRQIAPMLARMANVMLRNAAAFLHVRPRARALVVREIGRFPFLRRQLKAILLYDQAAAIPSQAVMTDASPLSRRTERVLRDLERACARANSRNASRQRPL
jgi:hypothetical protein